MSCEEYEPPAWLAAQNSFFDCYDDDDEEEETPQEEFGCNYPTCDDPGCPDDSFSEGEEEEEDWISDNTSDGIPEIPTDKITVTIEVDVESSEEASSEESEDEATSCSEVEQMDLDDTQPAESMAEAGKESRYHRDSEFSEEYQGRSFEEVLGMKYGSTCFAHVRVGGRMFSVRRDCSATIREHIKGIKRRRTHAKALFLADNSDVTIIQGKNVATCVPESLHTIILHAAATMPGRDIAPVDDRSAEIVYDVRIQWQQMMCNYIRSHIDYYRRKNKKRIYGTPRSVLEDLLRWVWKYHHLDVVMTSEDKREDVDFGNLRNGYALYVTRTPTIFHVSPVFIDGRESDQGLDFEYDQYYHVRTRYLRSLALEQCPQMDYGEFPSGSFEQCPPMGNGEVPSGFSVKCSSNRKIILPSWQIAGCCLPDAICSLLPSEHHASIHVRFKEIMKNPNYVGLVNGGEVGPQGYGVQKLVLYAQRFKPFPVLTTIGDRRYLQVGSELKRVTEYSVPVEDFIYLDQGNNHAVSVHGDPKGVIEFLAEPPMEVFAQSFLGELLNQAAFYLSDLIGMGSFPRTDLKEVDIQLDPTRDVSNETTLEIAPSNDDEHSRRIQRVEGPAIRTCVARVACSCMVLPRCDSLLLNEQSKF